MSRFSLSSSLRRVVANASVALVGTGLGVLAFAAPATAQDSKDQVTHYNPRNERVITVSGIVESNELSGLSLTTADSKTVKIEAKNVLRITWGEIPTAYTDARLYWDRKDYENALAQYRLAASDSDTRGVVRGAARIAAVRSLMRMGATDPSQYDACVDEADRYIDEFATGRDVPEAMRLKARALALAGKHPEATAAYLELYEKGKAETEGYSKIQGLQAGLAAAWTSLDHDDTAKARELFAVVQSGLTAAAEEALPTERHNLLGQASVAETGEGFCLLASGDARGAKGFFNGILSKPTFAAQGRFAATLGLGEALMASDENIEAQIQLARASALNPAGRDMTARAMLGLAKCLRKIGGEAGQVQAPILLTKIKAAFGDTPSAFHAAKLN